MVEQSTYRKKKSVIWPSLAGLFLVILLGLFILPNLLSTDWANNKLMQVVNDRIPGQINFDGLSLSWFDGIQSRDLTYVDRKEGIKVDVEEVTTSKGLLALAANYDEIGTITVKNPVIQVYLDEKTSTSDTGTASDTSSGAEQKKSQDPTVAQPDKPVKAGGPLMIPLLDGNLIITGGAVKAIFPDTKERMLIKGLELKAHLAGQENLLEYQTAFLSGESEGQVKGAGTLTLPSESIGRLDEIQSEAELDIEKWEIADLLSVLAYTADMPSGSGQINGRMNISGSTSTALKLKGNVTALQLMLQGGPLKSDTPSFDKVAVEIDAEKTDGITTLNQLTLTSALATATAAGTFDFPEKKAITTKLKLDLAELFAQFPSSLNLKEKTRVTSGMVDLEVKVNASDTDMSFDGIARLDELQGFAGGKKLVWKEPVIFEAKGGQSSTGFQLDKLSVQSPFLNGTGQGDFNHMSIQMAADMGAVTREVEKFIELDGMKFDGKMDLNLQVETKAEELRVATADVSINDFMFKQKNRVIAPRSSFKAKLATDLRVDQDMHPQEMLNTSLDFKSWIGSGAMSLGKFELPSDQRDPQVNGLDFKGAFDLQHLTVLLQTFDTLPQDTRLAGMATIHVRGALDGNRLQLEDAVVNTDQFLFTQKKKAIKEKQLNLAAKGTILLDEREISLKPLTLQSSSGEINIKEMTVADWSDMTKPIQATISANLDLKRITGMLADYLPEKWESDGKLALNLDVAPQGKLTSSASGKLLINDFVLKDGKQVLAPKGDVTAKLSALLGMDKGGAVSAVSNSKLNYQSWMSEGEVSIERIRVSNPQKEPEMEGMRYVGTIDVSALSGLLRSTDMLPADISLAGNADIDTRLSFKGNRLDLEKTTVDAADLMFQKDKLKFNEKKIQLTTGGFINLDERSVTLKPLDLKTGGNNIILPQLVIKDWNNLSGGVKTSGSIDLDLGLLTARLSDLLKQQSKITVTGRSALKIDADMTGGDQQFVRIDGKIGPLKIDVKDKQPVAEDSIRVKADLKGDILGQNFKLHEFELSSVPISLNAAGGITQDKLERVLNAEGSVNLDLMAVSAYLRSLADLEVEMIGDTESPFAIKVRSVDGRWIDLPKHSDFTTSFHADTIRGFGLLIESLEIPVQLANGSAEIDVQGTVNRGKMVLKSVIDFTADTPTVSVPENSDVLTGVGFSEAMSNDLLAHVHPLFKGAAISEGTMDLSLQHFNWPLDAAKRKDATFATSITFNEVVLRSGGLLTPLLEVMKANEREVILGDKPMECIGENDRVRCSPIEIKTRDHTLMLSGSVGFDKTLDYKAQIPVTRKMVSSDMYKYLEGTYISVPIGGTVSSPSLRKDILQTALKDLAIQAGKKQITDQAGKFLQKLFK